ncbi:nuclear factor of activated T cells 3 isoform X2 [Lycorma delicatula]|uniref:nuclear factor of activated T cells 3 isoform X2 n=1 Tax=Lycorma delicatula TaxID=130591 RepID=UPI003F50F159
MLLKYSQAQKRMKITGSGKPQRATGGMMKLTSTMMNVVPRIHRKVIKNIASKRPNSTHHRIPTALKRHELRPITAVPIDPCDNSNDSGLGFDQHIDYPVQSQQPVLRFPGQEAWSERLPTLKRQRIDIKLESDNANDDYAFPRDIQQEEAAAVPLCMPPPPRSTEASPTLLNNQSNSVSSDGRIQLQIISQPEHQHRARYQTEGSRGAVKDRSGNGFPVVKLVGYNRPAIIEVFIGTDHGRIIPHMFYQACRVSGKNSTPCVEKKVDGTVIIEIEALPERDMTVTCDCVGILKERNVDVEHRFPEESPGRSKKKSTRCRMAFRTIVTTDSGSRETLQVVSQPIVCTQPPGVPEIGKKSLLGCPATGGLEIVILGKNFLKDTKVIFQHEDAEGRWEAIVPPDKEFLQQSHLVCVVPPFKQQNIQAPVTVKLIIKSSDKRSDPHDFIYTPPRQVYNLYPGPLPMPQQVPAVTCDDACRPPTATKSGNKHVHPVMMWPSPLAIKQPRSSTSMGDEEMPPPPPLLPLAARRPSVPMIIPEALPREELKQEAVESPSSSPVPKSPSEAVADLSTTHSPSIATLRQFVSETPNLPSISVENYLTRIEVSPIENSNATSYVPKELVKPPIISDETQSCTSQLHSSPIMSSCNTVSDLVHSQIISDIPQQSSSPLHSSPIMSSCNTVSDLVQTQIISDISPQTSVSQLHSPPVLSSQSTVPSAVKQARFSNNLLSNVPAVIDSTVNPLPTTLIINSDNSIPFTQPLETNRSATSQCITEILSTRSTSPELPQPSTSLINESESARLTVLVTNSMDQPSSTERLDAFVNSAAESHISPGRDPIPPPVHLSPVSSDPSPSSVEAQSIISHATSHINPLLQGVQNDCPSSAITSTSLCSLLTGPPISRLEQPSQTSVTQTLLPTPLASPNRISDLVSQSISSDVLPSTVSIVQTNLPTSSPYSENQGFSTSQEMQTTLMNEVEQVKPMVKEEFMLMEITSTQCSVPSSCQQPETTSALAVTTVHNATHTTVKKTEEGIPLGSGIQELTQMSDHDLISYINPSCFDQVE